MLKHLNLLIFLFLISGCATHLPVSEQAPVLSYQAKEPLLVAVVDNRKRVKEGKPRSFVGVAHGTFGIPFDCQVDPWLAPKEGEDNLDFAQFLQKRIVTGLSNKDWKAAGVDVKAVPDLKEAEALMTKNKTTQFLVLQINEWFFSINLNWVTAFNFDTDTDAIIFTKEKGQLLSKNIAGRDVVDVKSDDSYPNQILKAYREQLNEILNDAAVKKALQGD